MAKYFPSHWTTGLSPLKTWVEQVVKSDNGGRDSNCAPKIKPRRGTTRFPLQIGLGMLLCMNYSCSSSRSMVSHDPFSTGEPSAQVATVNPGASENKSSQSQQTTADPYAALKASLPEQAAEDAGTVRVAKEWPALPEKRIGVTMPEREVVHTVMDHTVQLPVGGYERPLSEGDPWPAVDQQLVAELARNQTEIQQVSATTPSENSVDTAFVQQASYESSTTHQPIQTVSASVEHPAITASKPDVEFSPADARMPVQQASAQHPWANQPVCPPGSPAGSLPFPAGGADCHTCNPAHYPDEYLCDGGDRGYPVHYSLGYRNGLETQDTIAEYTDETGKRRMKPSNEVCVYAPRFGAVKTVTGSSENLSIDKALGAYDQVGGHAMNTRLKPNIEQQNEQVNAARVRSRVSGLDTEAITLGVNQATKVGHHSKLENTNTGYGFTGLIQQERAQTPVTMAGIQAAASWSRKQSPVIIASDVQGAETYSWFRPQEEVGLEVKSRPGNLYIDKSVDKTHAQSGDILTFTIRYKNTGDRSLFHINVIDNLTPRLEFLEGTATSDRDGRLVVEDNQEGSLILKWELSEELKGNEVGIVTFKARVR